MHFGTTKVFGFLYEKRIVSFSSHASEHAVSTHEG
jgi:hypothetical protein